MIFPDLDSFVVDWNFNSYSNLSSIVFEVNEPIVDLLDKITRQLQLLKLKMLS